MKKAPILYTALYALSAGFYFLNKHLLGVYRAYFEKFQKFDEYVVWLISPLRRHCCCALRGRRCMRGCPAGGVRWR